MKAIPSVIPYANLLMLNVAQAIIAIFLASDFLKRDKKLDTTEVIYMRSMTNGEYVLGKTVGNLVVFLSLNVIILLIAAIFNLAVGDVAVSWISYLNYFLLISVPTLVFIMGLSFFTMSILRNQAITFIILLGYVALTLFYLQDKFYFVFDYMVFNIPMIFSDFVGFGDKTAILIHRGIYLCLGLGFIFLTISFLKRLPQAKHFKQFSVVMAALFFAVGIYLGYKHVDLVVKNNKLREEMLELNDSYAKFKMPIVSSYQVNLKHKPQSVEVNCKMQLENNRAEGQKLFFTLNPGLKIKQVLLNGQEADYTRNLHMIELKELLSPGETAKLDFTYSGNINEAACYLDVDEENLQRSNKEMMYNIGKRHSFITNNYVLLTRENNWYPVPGATYGNKNKQWFARQFSKFELNVHTRPDLTAISQGEMKTDSTGNFTFTNKHNLSQLSLIIGEYEKTTQDIDGLDFNLYIKKGHDYFSEFFEEAKDTIPAIISESLQDFERTLDMYYPFERFSLVEVPVQFYSYDHIYTGERESIQPEMILYQEKALSIRDADFNGRLKRIQKWGHGEEKDLPPREQKIKILQTFLSSFTQSQGRPDFRRRGGNTQITEQTNPYYAFPMFYNHAYFVNSDRWPVTNRIFESYLKQASSDMKPGYLRYFQGTSEDEQANIALLENSFADLLNDPDQLTIIDNVIQLKGEALFSIIKRKAGEDKFDDFMYDFLFNNKFNTATIEDFNREIKEEFNIDLLPYMEDWFKSTELPAYLVGPVDAVEVLDGDRLKTMVKFKITNAENVEGIVSIQFVLGGSGGGRFFGRGGSDMETVNKLVHLEPNETKRLSFLLDDKPRRATIRTLTSKNIPAELNIPLMKIEEDKKAIPYEGEQVDDIPVRVVEDNEIIVDNEDTGFKVVQTVETSLLQDLLLKEEEEKSKYVGFSTYRPPRNWKATTNTGFYGKFIRSAYYIRNGEGDKKAVWTIPVKEGGYYDVYAYVFKVENRRRGRHGGNEVKGQYEYIIHHDDGDEIMSVDLKSAEEGWNHLGSYYFSPDSTKVELTNKSESRVIVADAIKIVKQN